MGLDSTEGGRTSVRPGCCAFENKGDDFAISGTASRTGRLCMRTQEPPNPCVSHVDKHSYNVTERAWRVYNLCTYTSRELTRTGVRSCHCILAYTHATPRLIVLWTMRLDDMVCKSRRRTKVHVEGAPREFTCSHHGNVDTKAVGTRQVRCKANQYFSLSNARSFLYLMFVFLVGGCKEAPQKRPGFAVTPSYTPSAAKTSTQQPFIACNRLMSRSNSNPRQAQYQLSPFAKPFLYLVAIFIAYSTVTDLAKFLGKSTFRPSATASQ